MPINLTNFLTSLAVAMGAAAAGTPAVAVGTNLFVNRAIEPSNSKDAAAYGVLRIYGGPKPSELLPVSAVSVQAMVSCSRPSEALALAQRLFESLYADLYEGGPKRPRHNWAITGKKIVAGTVADDGEVTEWRVRLVVLQGPPGAISTDPTSGKENVAFNFDVRFEPKETS